MKWTLIVIITFCFGFVRAQDTLRLYYSSGEAKLSGIAKQRVNSFMLSHDVSAIDSITLTGFTDSTGRHKFNQKLSFKRANEVKKHLKRTLLQDTLIKTVSGAGEESEKDLKGAVSHRRVELILYGVKSQIQETDSEESNTDFASSGCYRTANELLALCDITYFSKGSRPFVKLETDAVEFNPKQKYYSLSSKTKYPKLVKWEQVTSGELWWKRPRYTASMKAADFDKYGLLTTIDPKDSILTCTTCGADQSTDWKIGPQILPDVFLMKNLQVRKTFFSNELELIAPKEYVSVEKNYYLDSLTSMPLNWQVKRGRSGSPYYFTYVPIQFVNSQNFQLYSYQPACSEQRISEFKNECDTLAKHQCPAGTNLDFDYSFGLQLGYWKTLSDEGAISGYFQFNTGKFEFGFQPGITSKQRILTSLNADFHFFGFCPFKELYVSAGRQQLVEDFHRLGSFYSGFSGLAMWQRDNSSIVPEVHLGFSYWNKQFALGLDRIYLQGGIGKDFSLPSGPLTPILHFGCRFKI